MIKAMCLYLVTCILIKLVRFTARYFIFFSCKRIYQHGFQKQDDRRNDHPICHGSFVQDTNKVPCNFAFLQRYLALKGPNFES